MNISPARLRRELFVAIDSHFGELIRLYDRFERENADYPDVINPNAFWIWILDNMTDVDSENK